VATNGHGYGDIQLTSKYFELALWIMKAKLTRMLLKSKKRLLMSTPKTPRQMKVAIE
jgi:hypothetical protein